MAETPPPFAPRRIVAAVDAGPRSLPILEFAGELAAVSAAELNAVFVEDINLLRLAGLPFAREVLVSSAAEIHLSERRMVRVLRAQSYQVRQAVVHISSQRRLHGGLQIIRGAVIDSLLDVSAQCDLLVLGKDRDGKRRGRDGGIAAQIAARAACSVVVLDPARRQHAVICFFDGGAQAQRRLTAAASVARVPGRELWVLVVAQGLQDYHQRREAARRILAAERATVYFEQAASADLSWMRRIIMEQRGGIALLDALEWRDAANAHKLMTRLGGSLFLLN